MTTKKLLNPRYEVIGDYPNSPFKIGDIVKFNGVEVRDCVVFSTGEPQEFVRNPEKYPLLFLKID